MDFKKLYLGQLDDAQRAHFCALSETSDAYIRVHLAHRRRIPRPALMGRLLAACQHFDPSVTRDSLLAWFYNTAPAADAANVPPDGAAPVHVPTESGRAAVAGGERAVA